MIPDVLVMSSKVWDRISPEDQQIILQAAYDSTDAHKVMWDDAIQAAIQEAQDEMGVTFVNDIDKQAFRDATADMVAKYRNEYPGVDHLLGIIEEVHEKEAGNE